MLINSNKEDIKHQLEGKHGEIENIYISRSGRSFKVEFKTRDQADRFIISKDTSIGGILLKPEHKEFEVDPVIDQCWGCGQLNPNHSSSDYNCPRRCIKCGRSGHQFFECSIPKVKENMSEVHKWSRYCIPCDTQGDHTSIDHAACPTKREILRKRVREARANKEAETQAKQRDLDLITQVFDYTNTEIWPHIQSSPQQLKISTLVTLALVDEAVNPGVFQEKLARYSELNNLPKVRYRLQPNTAKLFFNTLVGSGEQSAP